jgi:hypothetical protein
LDPDFSRPVSVARFFESRFSAMKSSPSAAAGRFHRRFTPLRTFGVVL